jgi:CRP-like cAMP-binding protein
MEPTMTEKQHKTKTSEFPAGSIICREGEPGGDVLIIRSGRVEVFRTRNGREWPLAELKEGEILGVMTATTGGNRSASARAITAVSAVLVKNAQVRELFDKMPAWGTAIINDLVARVNYSDDLYIENATLAAGANLSDDPLALACMIASAMLPILQLLGSSGKSVLYEDFLVKLSEILGIEQPRIDHVIAIFMEEKLLPSQEGSPGTRKFELNSVKKLKAFGAFVADIRAHLRSPEAYQMMLAVGERDLLMRIAAAELGGIHDDDQYVERKISDLQSSLRRETSESLNLDVLKRADGLGYLSFQSKGEEHSVRFQPAKLVEILRCYATAKRLNPRVFAERRTKKAAAY